MNIYLGPCTRFGNSMLSTVAKWFSVYASTLNGYDTKIENKRAFDMAVSS